ncbi:MAG TPA: M48 family metalloprotease [Armatimonadota bacterium]|jgi:Zn-dependent protease with chaperone function
MFTKASRFVPIFGALLMVMSIAVPARAEFSKDEIKMGEEAAKEVEKESKLCKDEALTKRVSDIGQSLVKSLNSPKDVYVFKVLDEKDVNAFALPGGFVYVYKGLIDSAESDDELAGVMAHEITHADHHHAKKIMKKSQPWDLATMAVLLAGIFSGKDITAPAQVIGVLQTSKINGYTIDLEKDADAGGMNLMLKSKYNAVGMLTFMERLARTEQHSGSSAVDLGIFRTHPWSADRAIALRNALEKAGVDINRRAVMKSLRVTVEPVKDVDAAALVMDNKTVITLAPDGKTAALDRGKAAAQQLNDLLNKDLSAREVYVAKNGTDIVARNRVVISVNDADARLAKSTPAAVAAEARKKVFNVLLSEYLRLNT